MSVMNNSVLKSVQPVVTAGAYSANDVVGGLMTFQVTPVGHPASGNIEIHALVIGDASTQKAAMDIWVFKSAPTTIADNGAFSTVADADIRDLCQCHIPVLTTDYTTAGSNALGEVKNINRTIELTDGAFYVFAVCSGTPTYGAITDLRFTFDIFLNF